MISKFISEDNKLYTYSSTFLDKIIGVGPINWPILALARFFLAFIVVAAHIVPHVNNAGPLKWIDKFNAFNAIMGFLLISGLSIGKSILKDRQGYFLRRAQRIYPVYLASIALQYLVMPQEITILFVLVLLVNFLFLNQFVIPTSYVGPAWTLALEVWLYSLAPVFLKLSYKTLLILTGISFFCYCFYTCGRSLFHWSYYSGTNFGINLLLLSFIWIIGFTLAVYTEKAKEIISIIAVIFIVHFLLTCFIAIGARIKHHELSLFLSKDAVNHVLELICLIFIYFIVVSNRNFSGLSNFNRKLFNFLGNISYPLYLTHFSILVFCNRLGISNWFILVLCCLTAATIVYWIFDFYSKKRAA